MTTLEDVRDHLLADGTVSGFIDDRLYALKRPQGTPLPAVVYQLISTSRPHTWTGSAGMQRQRVQFTTWAEVYTDAHRITKAIIESLDGFSGAIFDNQRDLLDEDTEFYGRTVDYFIWLEEE